MNTQSISTPPTRRNILSVMAGITATAVTAWDCLYRGQPHPDGELLAAVERFAAADAAQTEAYFSGMEAVDALNLPTAEATRRKNLVGAAQKPVDAELDLMLHEIASMPARTTDGRAAKARVVQRWIGDGWEILKVPTRDPWQRVVWSLAQDSLQAGWMA